ncbi:hypothetical protein MHUMG1_10598 [Metarhizium humberi]|uniref:Xylanolytic transcriptional activator regulatory domain-containing protein n=1 Tax=Metarhizium humberi TaxID=2596975 RepID=A0A9P8M132_9HYPO|nr:hypothetical protein MHUMG1_10598 [Metarhizium humberi]
MSHEAAREGGEWNDGPGAVERVKYLDGVVQELKTKLESISSPKLRRDDGVHSMLNQEYKVSSARPHLTYRDEGEPGLDKKVTQLRTEFGQLAVGDGRSRYIVSNFWADLTEKVYDVTSILEDLAEEESQGHEGDERYATKAPSITSILGLSPYDANLRQMYPAPDKFTVYWRLYKDNCNPVIRILHMPTIEPLILHYQSQLDNVPRGFEALLFAIYFSAVASLSDNKCMEKLGSEKSSLINVYKAGMEHTLARAHLLETDEFIVLQAFAIFLSSLRNYCNLRLMWSLTSIATRLAQNIGIHRDGMHFRLSPLTIETRQRLWWRICALDARAAEDSGYNTSIHVSDYNTQMPRNINDTDLAPNMTELPVSKIEFTEMTFGIVTFRAAVVFQTLQNMSPGTIGRWGKLHTAESLEERSSIILKYQDMLQKLFLGHDPSNPFYWYTALVSRILLSKIWLVAYYPSLRLETCGGQPDHIKDSLFVRSITIIESQWYAIAFILTKLYARTRGELVEKAWRAITAVLKADRFTQPPTAGPVSDMDDVEFSSRSKFGNLHDFEYNLLNKLLRKARAARLRQQLSPDSTMPYRVPDAEDFLAAAHRFDDEIISSTGELNPTSMNHCESETGYQVAMSADYVKNQLLDNGHKNPFDHLIYGSLQHHVNMTYTQLPSYFSDGGPAPQATL